jgi:hypothetical protein
MKTLFVGDLHLQQSLILPKVSQVIEKQQVERIVLLGDYTDQYGQTHNDGLYHFQMDFLGKWVEDQRASGKEVVVLIGNHDIPYLYGGSHHYSTPFKWVQEHIRKTLFGLKAQVAYEFDDQMLASHAGLTEDYELEDWMLRPLTEEDELKLRELDDKVGYARGGSMATGGIVWADYWKEHYRYKDKVPDSRFKAQVFGHTPVRSIMNRPFRFLSTYPVYMSEWPEIWDVDVFSLGRNQEQIAIPAVLVYDSVEQKFEVVGVPITQDDITRNFYIDYAEMYVTEKLEGFTLTEMAEFIDEIGRELFSGDEEGDKS